MRFVAIALILLSLPIFIALLNRYRDRRDWALFAMGVMMFLIGSSLQIDAAIITWRLWQGTIRGIFISPIDTLALALIITRTARAKVHYLWLMLIYLIPPTLSLLVSYMPMATLFAPMQILRITLMFYALAGEFTRPSALRSFFGGIAVGLLIQCGFVVQQKLSGVVQARGTADHQNILGMMVEASVIPLFALALEGEKKKLFYVGIVAALLIVAGGGSRATMIFTGAGMSVLMILSLLLRPTARKGKLLAISTLVAVVVVPLGFATLRERFGEGSINLTEDQVRASMEQAAKSIASDHPLGSGSNTLVLVANEGGYYQRAGVPWGGTSLTAPVHNSYLLMRAETGWLGELAVIMIIVIPALSAVRFALANRKSPIGGLALATFTVFITIAFHMNYEYAWHLEVVQRLFFVNLAMLSALHAMQKASRRKHVMPKTSASFTANE